MNRLIASLTLVAMALTTPSSLWANSTLTAETLRGPSGDSEAVRTGLEDALKPSTTQSGLEESDLPEWRKITPMGDHRGVPVEEALRLMQNHLQGKPSPTCLIFPTIAPLESFRQIFPGKPVMGLPGGGRAVFVPGNLESDELSRFLSDAAAFHDPKPPHDVLETIRNVARLGRDDRNLRKFYVFTAPAAHPLFGEPEATLLWMVPAIADDFNNTEAEEVIRLAEQFRGAIDSISRFAGGETLPTAEEIRASWKDPANPLPFVRAFTSAGQWAISSAALSTRRAGLEESQVVVQRMLADAEAARTVLDSQGYVAETTDTGLNFLVRADQAPELPGNIFAHPSVFPGEILEGGGYTALSQYQSDVLRQLGEASNISAIFLDGKIVGETPAAWRPENQSNVPTVVAAQKLQTNEAAWLAYLAQLAPGQLLIAPTFTMVTVGEEQYYLIQA